MKRTLVFLTALTLALAGPGAMAAKPKKGAVPKKIYCWEENGVRVCGDALPASAVNNARTEINGRTGLATRQVDRVLTPEEQAAAAAAAQQAQLLQQQQALLLQQQQQLVMSYANEGELNRAYDDKEAGVRKTMGETNKNIASLRTALIQKLEYATEMQMQKKGLPTKSSQSIQELHQQVRLQEGNLAQQEAGLLRLKQERAANLALFQSLQAQRQATATQAVPAAAPTQVP